MGLKAISYFSRQSAIKSSIRIGVTLCLFLASAAITFPGAYNLVLGAMIQKNDLYIPNNLWDSHWLTARPPLIDSKKISTSAGKAPSNDHVIVDDDDGEDHVMTATHSSLSIISIPFIVAVNVATLVICLCILGGFLLYRRRMLNNNNNTNNNNNFSAYRKSKRNNSQRTKTSASMKTKSFRDKKKLILYPKKSSSSSLSSLSRSRSSSSRHRTPIISRVSPRCPSLSDDTHFRRQTFRSGDHILIAPSTRPVAPRLNSPIFTDSAINIVSAARLPEISYRFAAAAAKLEPKKDIDGPDHTTTTTTMSPNRTKTSSMIGLNKAMQAKQAQMNQLAAVILNNNDKNRLEK